MKTDAFTEQYTIYSIGTYKYCQNSNCNSTNSYTSSSISPSAIKPEWCIISLNYILSYSGQLSPTPKGLVKSYDNY